MQKKRTEKIVAVAVLSAVALVLYLLEFPLLPNNYLKMDFSDLPALIGGVLYGPVAGILIELIKNLLELLFKGIGTTMGFGNFQNFIIGCAYVIPVSLILRKSGSSANGIAAACAVGGICLIAVGFLSNLLIAPLYFRFFIGQELSMAGAYAAAVTATLFNLLKTAILMACTVLLVKLAIPPLKHIVDKA